MAPTGSRATRYRWLRMPRYSSQVRSGLLFVAISGAGWLLDVSVLMTLSGPAGWGLVPANVVSGSCGVLFVFAVSSKTIFQRNSGSVMQKVAVLLAFNLLVILASSFALAAIARAMAHLGMDIPQAALRLAAKVLVTPLTLLLNYVVVRFLVERFIGVGAGTASVSP